MKLTKRVVAMLLTVMMILTVAPLGVFATETATGLVYGSEIYEDETLNGYKQYETMWTDSTYVKGDVKVTVYFDTENATATRDVIFYVINWNGERIGTDSDVDIVTDNIEAAASVESGNRAAVIVADFGGNENAVANVIEQSMAELRSNLLSGKKLTVWADPTAETKTETTVAVHSSYVFVLPAGYRVKRDIPYYETDVHASLGTRNHVMYAWNQEIAGLSDDDSPETVYYAYHSGSIEGVAADEEAGTAAIEACTYDHTAYPDVECIAGAPQEIGGVVVPYEAGHAAPVVSRVEDCRKRDGSPLDYTCRLDIIYPSGTDVEATPVFVQAATHSPRMNNIGTRGRTALVGMLFSGYTAAAYDYAYVPMARDDHYGYIDNYGTHWQNGAKTSRAAIRCIRYFAEELGYNDDLIGAAGISKGTPTTSVLSTINNKNVVEQKTFSYTIDGTSVDTRGLYYEGDLEADGSVTEGKTTQPYMTYENGYDGVNDGDYTGTRTGEISSEVSVVYCAAGDGANWLYQGNNTITVGSTNSVTGEETQHVPMVLSCGYHDQYGCWNHWPKIVNRFETYSKNPFLAISMEDMGHDYPSGWDALRDYDRYLAFFNFFHSEINPDLYTPEVAWTTPLNGEDDVKLTREIEVQFVSTVDADTLSNITLTNVTTGETVDGKWTVTNANVNSHFIFTCDGLEGGCEYRFDIPTTVTGPAGTKTEGLKAAVSKTFTTEGDGSIAPIADAYVSEIEPNQSFVSAEELEVEGTPGREKIAYLTFDAAQVKAVDKISLRLPDGVGAGQQVYIYILDDYSIPDDLTYSTRPTLSEDQLLGTYTLTDGVALDLMDLSERVSGKVVTLAIAAVVPEGLFSFALNFEADRYVDGATIPGYNSAVSSDDTGYPKPSSTACYDDNYPWREGGATPKPTVYTENGNKMAKVTSTGGSNRIKIYNSMTTTGLTAEDVGRKFYVSFDVKTDKAAVIQYGVMPPEGWTWTQSSTKNLAANTWTTVTKTITVTEAMVTDQIGMLTIQFNTNGATYYFDNIIVTDANLASAAITATEVAYTPSAALITETVPAGQALADTYVSELEPDTAFGDSEVLKLSGRDSMQQIILATYSRKLLESRDYVELSMPATLDGVMNVSVYVLDGYTFNENAMTYNTLPEYDASNLVGTYDLVAGTNRLDISSLTDKVSATRFTLIFVSSDKAHGYSLDFESYEDGASLPFGNEVITADASGRGYSSQYVFRGGGAMPAVYAAVDPDDANNMVGKTTASQTYNRAKIYNTVAFRKLTSDDIGRTLRFSFKVKSGNSTSLRILAYICGSYGSTALNTAADVSGITNAGWTTVTNEVTITESLLTENEPTFTFELKTKNGIYYLDDFKVVEIDANGNEIPASELVIASGEDEASLSHMMIVDGAVAGLPVADTYVSENEPDAVFGYDSTLRVDTLKDREKIAFLSYNSAILNTRGYLMLDLKSNLAESKSVSVYLLDNYKVDESALTWNTMPALETLVGIYELSAGDNMLDVAEVANLVTGDYFTLVIRGNNEYEYVYERDFEELAVGYEFGEGTYYTDSNSNGASDDDDIQYGYADPTKDAKYQFYRRGGSMTLFTVKADPADETNNVIYSAATNTYSGRFKLYGALSYDDLTTADVGSTYRLTFKVKSATSSKVQVTAGIMPSYGQNFATGTTKTVSNIYGDEWTEISLDYTITAADVKATNHPMFTIQLDTCNGASYYFDDFTVTKLAFYYGLDFENYEAGDTVPSYNSQSDSSNANAPENETDLFSTYYVGREGGSVPEITVKEENGNKIGYLTASYGYNRMKFFNSFTRSTLTSDDIGRSFLVSFRVKTDTLNSGTKAEMTFSRMSPNGTYGSKAYDTAVECQLEVDTWTTFSHIFTVDQGMIDNNAGMLTFGFSVQYATYCFDDITVVEVDSNGHALTPTVMSLASDESNTPANETALADGNDGNEVSVDLDDKITVLETTVYNETAGKAGTVTDIFRVSDGTTVKSLLSMENDTGKLFFEMDGEKFYLHNNSGSTYFTANDGAINVTAIYDDANGTVRFAVGELLASYTNDGVIAITEGLSLIDGGLSGDTTVRVFRRAGVGEVMFGELSASTLKADTAEIIGVQKAIATDAIRILAGIDSLYYGKLGFTVELLDENGAVSDVQNVYSYNSVFTSVNVGGVEETAESLGCNYIACLVIRDIASNGTIRVTPYVTVDGDNAGESVTYQISVDGGLTVEKIG